MNAYNNYQKNHQKPPASDDIASQNESGIISDGIKELVQEVLRLPHTLTSQNIVDKEVLYIRHGITTQENNPNILKAQSSNIGLSDE